MIVQFGFVESSFIKQYIAQLYSQHVTHTVEINSAFKSTGSHFRQ